MLQLEAAHSLLCGLQRNSLHSGSNSSHNVGIEMLNVDICGHVSTEHFEGDIMCLERAIRQLISSVKFTKIEAAFGRQYRELVAGQLAINRNAAQERVVVRAVILDGAGQGHIPGWRHTFFAL